MQKILSAYREYLKNTSEDLFWAVEELMNLCCGQSDEECWKTQKGLLEMSYSLYGHELTANLAAGTFENLCQKTNSEVFQLIVKEASTNQIIDYALSLIYMCEGDNNYEAWQQYIHSAERAHHHLTRAMHLTRESPNV